MTSRSSCVYLYTRVRVPRASPNYVALSLSSLARIQLRLG